MSPLDDARAFLPRHLTEEETKKLFEDIRKWPGNLDARMYMKPVEADAEAVLQGDGIRDLLIVNLPNPEIKPAPALILSNSCDSDAANERAFASALCYAPIFRLDKYIDTIRKSGKKTSAYIENHESNIRRQELTQIFFLPKGGDLDNDSIVFLDRINNCQSSSFDRSSLPKTRLFSLSTYGHWLLLLKISIHFSRLTDKTDRSGPLESSETSTFH